MGWLKEAAKQSAAPKHGIIDILKKNMGGYEAARSTEVVHASDITKDSFCPRQYALWDVLGKSKEGGYVSTALRATFDIGNATAKVFIENWAGQHAIGDWKCQRCNKVVFMQSKPGLGCINNGAQVLGCMWTFMEPRFQSVEFDVNGGIDVFMDMGSQKWVAVELKIIRLEDFDAIVAPLPEHRIRTSLYLKLIADSNSIYKDKINLHEARVLYVSRGYGKKNEAYGEVLPFKEFVVNRDDEIIAKPLAKAKQVKVWRAEKKMPAGICNTALDKYAKNCNVCKGCFSGEYPAEQVKPW